MVTTNIDIMFFDNKVDKEITQLNELNPLNEEGVITEEDITGLPEPMQKYLRYTQIIGKNRINNVAIKQVGSIRQTPDESWMPFEAEQYFTINSPGFLWSASMKKLPFISVKARDLYLAGKGNMYIKLPPFVTIADATGYEIDQGSALRYLAEMVWFPTAYLSDYISYKPIDNDSCEAIIDYQGITASAILHFNQNGEITGLTAKRYREDNGQYSLDEWAPRMSEYKEINGVKVPASCEVIWILDSGDFSCIKIELTDIKYDNF